MLRVDWADFRTPPINLWVMPPMDAWLRAASKRKHRRRPLAQSGETSEIQRRIMHILRARGGCHGCQD